MLSDMYEAVFSSSKILRAANMSEEEVQTFMERARKSMKNQRVRSYTVW